MMISAQAIALWGAALVTLALMCASLSIGWKALSRLTTLLTRLDMADGRTAAATAALCDGFETLSAANEAQGRQLSVLTARLERLGADLVRREARDGEPKPHHAAVLDAIRGGDGADELTREHGLSRGEAELLVLLHRREASSVSRVA